MLKAKCCNECLRIRKEDKTECDCGSRTFFYVDLDNLFIGSDYAIHEAPPEAGERYIKPPTTGNNIDLY